MERMSFSSRETLNFIISPLFFGFFFRGLPPLLGADSLAIARILFALVSGFVIYINSSLGSSLSGQSPSLNFFPCSMG